MFQDFWKVPSGCEKDEQCWDIGICQLVFDLFTKSCNSSRTPDNSWRPAELAHGPWGTFPATCLEHLIGNLFFNFVRTFQALSPQTNMCRFGVRLSCPHVRTPFRLFLCRALLFPFPLHISSFAAQRTPPPSGPRGASAGRMAVAHAAGNGLSRRRFFHSATAELGYTCFALECHFVCLMASRVDRAGASGLRAAKVAQDSKEGRSAPSPCPCDGAGRRRMVSIETWLASAIC